MHFFAIDHFRWRLAGNEGVHNIWDKFKFLPHWTTDNREKVKSMKRSETEAIRTTPALKTETDNN